MTITSNTSQIDEKYYNFNGKFASYSQLIKKGWTDKDLEELDVYEKGNVGFRKVSIGKVNKPVGEVIEEKTQQVQQPKPVKPAGEIIEEKTQSNPSWLAETEVKKEEEKEKPKEQSITEGNFTYIRSPQTGKVYVKHKDAEAWQDLDTKRETSPNMVPVIDSKSMGKPGQCRIKYKRNKI
jgi:hypothetical protein